MRPTIIEERAHAIASQLDDWQLPDDERRALQSRFTTAWRRNGPFVAAGIFAMTLFAVAALTFLCKTIGATEFAAAAISIGVAELLILRKKMYGSGIESALWIGGLIAFISGLPSSGKPEAILVIAAAFAIAGWRMQNPFFAAIAAFLVAAYFIDIWSGAQNYWRAASVPLALAVIAIGAKARTWRRPWIDTFWSLVAIVMPLVAEIGGHFASDSSGGNLRYALVYAILGGIALAAGLRLREHALLVAAAVSFGIAGYEARDFADYPGEWKLIASGIALLAFAALVARALRGRTQGFVATPARLTRYDELVKLGGTMVVGSAIQGHAAESDPGVAGSHGGSNSFGGAGSTTDY
jgi:hypothetical protein